MPNLGEEHQGAWMELVGKRGEKDKGDSAGGAAPRSVAPHQKIFILGMKKMQSIQSRLDK